MEYEIEFINMRSEINIHYFDIHKLTIMRTNQSSNLFTEKAKY